MMVLSLSAQVSGDCRSKNVSSTWSTATLIFAGTTNYSYSVMRLTNLTSWKSIWTTNASANGALQIIAPSAPQLIAYYQLRYNP
jgi:hypothetical protein